ncbi:MAG TPA: benzoate-CoA ligase family protein [Variovorax sp.]
MHATLAPTPPAHGLAGNVVDYLFERRMAPEEARRPYLVGAHATHSFGDLYERVCQVGHLLRSLGVKPGDRVLFSVVDGIDFPALFLGAMKIGAVSLPLNTFLQSTDYAYYIRDSGAKLLVVDAALVPKIEEIRDAHDFPSLLFVANGRAQGWRELDAELAGQPRVLDTLARRPDEQAFWLYSSGSTGDPKGVVHTHEHIYWACELFGLGESGMGMRRDDEILCPPKMFFAYGLGNQVYFPLRAGARVFMEPAPIKPQALLERMIATRPTMMMAVPTLFAGLLDLMRSLDRDLVHAACSRLRICVSGGELLPPAIYRQWLETTGTEILDGVGTTEMTHMFLFNRPGAAKPGSCGQLIPGYEARFLDDEGRDVPEGEIGNLFVRGPTAARTYWNKAQKTASTMWDGGVLTGDKSYRDTEGYYFHVGRVDDMLRVGGIWVSPTEIEATLTEHPGVLECAVIGVADEQEMIKPNAFVVVRHGYVPDQELRDALGALVRGKLAHIKCPRRIEFVSELPKTATGKIQRFRLRARERSAGEGLERKPRG